MATFITDPRIAYAQAARNDYRKRSLAPIQLPRNPYGGSPVASALQNLTYGYLAGQEGRQANQLQEAQTAAQNEIMGQILRDQQATAPGAGGYLPQSMVSAPEPAGMRAAVGPTMPTQAMQPRVQINRPTRPTMQPIDARVAKTAGIDPAQLAMLRVKARQQGDKATEAAIMKAATEGYQDALRSQDEALIGQYEIIIDPVAARKSQVAISEKIEQRKIDANIRNEDYQRELLERRENQVKAFDTEIKEMVFVQQQDIDANPGRYLAAAPTASTKDQKYTSIVVNSPVTIDGKSYKVGETPFFTAGDMRNPDVTEALRNNSIDITRLGDAPLPGKPEPTKFSRLSDSNTPLAALAAQPSIHSFNIRSASTGDFGGIFDKVGTTMSGLVGLNPLYPAAQRTLDEASNLDQVGIKLQALLAREISPRVPVFVLEISEKLIPQSSSSNAKNASKIRALIPNLQLRLRADEDALNNPDLTISNRKEIEEEVAYLGSVVSGLARSLLEYEGSSGQTQPNRVVKAEEFDQDAAAIGTIFKENDTESEGVVIIGKTWIKNSQGEWEINK